MSRVAIVTGGTRGIGEAISLALRDLGYTVAANYAGNEERAKGFTDATGIAAYKWDVGDHGACLSGCEKVAADLGCHRLHAGLNPLFGQKHVDHVGMIPQ